VRTVSSAPTFSNSTFELANYYGARLDGVSEPVIQDCAFSENTRTPIAMTLLSDPVTSGNSFTDNGYTAIGIIGETLAQDVTWVRRNVGQIENIPYVLLSDLTVGTGAILTLEPGLVIKFLSSSVDLHVQRGLIAEGGADPESLIVFTSVADDFYGGDTNGDSTDTDGFNIRWGYIDVQSTAMSSNVRFDNCVFSYSYNSASYGAVVVKGSVSPSFENCIFGHNTVGINYQQASGDSTVGKVDSCDFFDNSSYAIKNTGMAHTVWAKNCWWGHNSGPDDPSDDTGSGGLYNPTGLGDPVTDMVDYSPWGTQGVENYLLGDVSLNGEIHAYDASLILRWLVADTTLTAQQQTVGDVTCAAGLSALDASYILQFMAGQIPFFPCEYESIPTFRMLAIDGWPGTSPGDYKISLDDFTLEPGRITLPVNLSGSGEVYAAHFDIESSSEHVRIAGIEKTQAAARASFYSKVGDDGVARIALASVEPLPAAALVMIEMVIDEEIGEDEQVIISFNLAQVNEQDLTSTVIPARGMNPERFPISFALEQNAPNPFDSGTTIRFAIPGTVGGPVSTKIQIFSATGRTVRVLVDEPYPAGIHEAHWDGTDERGAPVGSGVYFYRLETGTFSAERKMIHLR